METEVSKTCRTCLCNSEELVSIYNGDDNNIVEMLEYILDTQLEIQDELPQKVCYECFKDISRCYLFKTKCNNSFKILRNLIDKRKNVLAVMQIKVEPEIHISNQFIEAEDESRNTLDASHQDLTVVEMEEISIKSEPTEVTLTSRNEMLTQQLQLYEKETIPPTPLVSASNNQVENEYIQEQNNATDIHTVQYLIRELEGEQDSVDEVLEVKVNIRHCPSCGAGFAQQTDFNEHIKKCRPRKQMKALQGSPNKNSKKHLCPYCDKAFPRPCRLKNHLRKHPAEVLASKLKEEAQTPNKHKCPHCDLIFDLESSFKYHLSSHTKETQWNNSISSFKYLNMPLTTHTNPKRHKCKECHQEFELSSQLKIHMLFHKAKHPYVCKLCQKQFNNESEIKAHSIRVHNDKKPFKCKFCAAGFTGKYHLVYHQRYNLCRGK